MPTPNTAKRGATRIDKNGVERYIAGGHSVALKRATHKRWYEKPENKDSNRTKHKRWVEDFKGRDPVGYKRYRQNCSLWSEFRLRPEDYVAMFDRQGGLCPICLKPLVLYSQNCCVDHDHSKPKGVGNRALLHNKCNATTVAVCETSPENVLRAFFYLSTFTSGGSYEAVSKQIRAIPTPDESVRRSAYIDDPAQTFE